MSEVRAPPSSSLWVKVALKLEKRPCSEVTINQRAISALLAGMSPKSTSRLGVTSALPTWLPMIVNEMSGSGGDYLPYMFHARQLGTIVGKRTWGGLVHTADTPPFVDGGSMIAPRGGYFSADGRWAVENTGMAPDVDVENWPKDIVAGHDSQLERAVQIAMKQLTEKPVTRMMKEPPPPTWGKRANEMTTRQ